MTAPTPDELAVSQFGPAAKGHSNRRRRRDEGDPYQEPCPAGISNRRRQAAQIVTRLLSTGSVLPDGAPLLLCGPADRGWRVISVWDSPEARDQFFTERLGPAYEAAGLSSENVTRAQFKVQMLIAGGLVGPPAPA
jgi:hypothetical protein